MRKRSRADGLPEGFFDEGTPNDSETIAPQTSKTFTYSGARDTASVTTCYATESSRSYNSAKASRR